MQQANQLAGHLDASSAAFLLSELQHQQHNPCLLPETQLHRLLQMQQNHHALSAFGAPNVPPGMLDQAAGMLGSSNFLRGGQWGMQNASVNPTQLQSQVHSQLLQQQFQMQMAQQAGIPNHLSMPNTAPRQLSTPMEHHHGTMASSNLPVQRESLPSEDSDEEPRQYAR